MNDTHDDLRDDEDASFLTRIKESPRTVSALIIILIVAAAIYAFSGDRQTTENTEGEQAATSEATTEQSEEGDAVTNEAAVTPAPSQAAPSPVTQEQINETVQQLPQARRTGTEYVEVAQPGDGYTHTARRATTRWLAENQAGFAVTNEHRIYIEDYIQNRLGKQGLSVNQEVTVSFDLVKEAVTSAQQLNEQQLRNLSKYTAALT